MFPAAVPLQPGSQAVSPALNASASRRNFLRQSVFVAAGGLLLGAAPKAVAGIVSPSRVLAFAHLHTHEHLSLAYALGNQILPKAYNRLNHFLRDHYTGEVGHIDPQLLDVLYRLRMALGTREPFQVISGYRSPLTNDRLRNTREGGVAKKSLHMEGKAIDIRLPGVALADLRDAAKSLQAGGVGFYPRDNFVHVDTGQVRYW